MNQSDSDKRAAKKKSTQLSGDLNATHKSLPLKKEIFNLSQKVQKKMQPVTNISALINTEELAKLDNEFPSLIKDTNLLAEQVKKLSAFKIVPYPERYKVANEKVSLVSLRPDLGSIIRARNKNFFLALEEALDNTTLIDAYPHEATLFKAGVLYKLFLDKDPSPRVIEMSIALREDDLPDGFKYIQEEHKFKKARWMELGQQAYAEIINSNDENAKQRFEASCESLKKFYLGLRNAEQINVDDILDNEIIFPEISNTSPENQLNHKNDSLLPKVSTRIYVNFTGNELDTLKHLIPSHKKNTVFIEDIGGIALDTFMRACLSTQTTVNEYNDTELRKRTAAERFILKGSSIFGEAQRTMNEDKTGKMFDPHQGYVSSKATPESILKKINEEGEIFQKALIIITECKLVGPELIKRFFNKVFNMLKLKVSNNLKKELSSKQYEKIQKNTDDFNIDKIEKYLGNYKKTWIEMQDFQVIVTKVGAEHIKIFAAEPGGKASYSIPNPETEKKDAAQSVSSRPPSLMR